MSHYVIFAKFYFGTMWLVCITFLEGPTYECTTMVEISPFFPQTHTLVQIMAIIQVMIDYNCYHCHKDDCLGGKVPGSGETQCGFFFYRVSCLISCSLCFNFSLHFLCLSAFICHHNSFLIYGSLEQPTLAKWSQITHISVGSALIIGAVFAVSGYTTFTGYTQGKGRRT